MGWTYLAHLETYTSTSTLRESSRVHGRQETWRPTIRTRTPATPSLTLNDPTTRNRWSTMESCPLLPPRRTRVGSPAGAPVAGRTTARQTVKLRQSGWEVHPWAYPIRRSSVLIARPSSPTTSSSPSTWAAMEPDIPSSAAYVATSAATRSSLRVTWRAANTSGNRLW